MGSLIKWQIARHRSSTTYEADLIAKAHITSGEFGIVLVFPDRFVQFASYYEAPDGESCYQLDEL